MKGVWPLNIFLMCLRSAQVCSESLLEHFSFYISFPPNPPYGEGAIVFHSQGANICMYIHILYMMCWYVIM